MKTDKIRIHPSTMENGTQTEELTIHYNGNVHIGLNTLDLQEKILVTFNPETHDVTYRWREKDYSETNSIKEEYAEHLASILRKEFLKLRQYIEEEISFGKMKFIHRYLGRTFRSEITLNFDGRGNFKADWVSYNESRGLEPVMCEAFNTYQEAVQFFWKRFEVSFRDMWRKDIEEDYDEYLATLKQYRECPKCGDPLNTVEMRADSQIYLLDGDLAEHDYCVVYMCQECCHELAHSYDDMLYIMQLPRRTDAKQN